MFFLREPTEPQIEGFLQAQKNARFSYPEVGRTRTGAPPYYKVDHNRIQLGTGEETYRRAVAALNRGAMFDLGWVRLAPAGVVFQEGTNMAVAAETLGFWSLNATRVVYTLDVADIADIADIADLADGAIHRHGFAYGTLRDHAERGEERFTVEWHRNDDSVWYDLFAFSKPNHWLAQIGYPATRAYQRRFGRDSKAAMLRAVQAEASARV